MKAGWEVKPLGEVCSFENGDRGKNYPGKKCFVASGVPFINAGLVDDGEVLWDKMNYIPEDRFELLSRGKIQSGDFLFCLRGSLGKFGQYVSDKPAAIASSLVIIRTFDDVLASFFAYYLRSAHCAVEIERLAAGAAQPNLGANDLKRFAIPIPPLEEQKRIVAVLDAAFEGLTRAKENAEANLQNARELFGGFTRTKMGAADLKAKTVKLSDVCAIESKLIDPKLDEHQDQLHLGAGNMITESDVLVDVKTASEEGLISGKHPFTENDVLYSKIRPYLKKVARPPFAGLCSADVYPLTPSDQLDRNYLFHLLMSPEFTDYAIAGSGRAGMPKVNRKHLFEYEFELPSIKDQVNIANDIDRLRAEATELEANYCAKLTDIADLRQSLLQKAFAGELT